MRRISLALALVGAVAAAGCSGGAKSSSGAGDNQGVAGSTFTLTVNVWKGGSVKSQTGTKQADGSYVYADDGKISCSASAAAATCSADYDWGTVVRVLPTTNNSATIYFNGFAGDCQGYVCDVAGNAEKSVIAMYTAKPESHPNWIGDSTVHPAKTAELNCMQCHGSGLQGIGIAPDCYSCHKPDGTGGPVKQAAATAKETCTECHPQNIGTLNHQAIYNTYTDATKLVATIDSVTSTPDGTGKFTVEVLFTLKKGTAALTSADYSALAQKRLSLTRYTASSGFETATAKTLTAATFVANGQFKSTTTGVKFDPTGATENGFFYFYFADKAVVPPEGHYLLPDNTVSVSKLFGTIPWTSTANASACEKCHGAPYAKHGYRQAVVAGLPDFVACKACHTDQRGGVDFNLAMTSEDPLHLAELEAIGAVCGGELCWLPEDEETYAYTATTMQDTHISHAKEFLYPQQMANCATCHEGKLNRILTDANFTGAVCKSCHLFVAKDGNIAKRAPKLEPAYHSIDWVKGVLLHTDNNGTPTDPADDIVTEQQCNECHSLDPATGSHRVMYGNEVPLFADLHTGYNKIIYSDDAGTRYANTITTQITSATFDTATNKVTVDFSVSGAGLNAAAIIKPTVVVSLYGFETKDFVVSGHGTQSDGTTNLEWTEGAMQRSAPTKSSNSARLTVTPATAAAGVTTWQAVADLTIWASKITAGDVKRIEIAILPALGVDQTKTPDSATNPYLAIGGVAKTFDLTTNALLADNVAYGRDIVDPAKCNKCHDALATEFHNANYGSAGVVGCRVCHFVGSGGSHLEMQSRSIDSYVHALHSFQKMDVNSINFNDEISAFEYEHHISATYPNFTTLSCESCHNAGKYDLPNQYRSLPSILSASSTVNKARNIGGISTVVVGPGSRACGGCHRAEFIKADDAVGLAGFDQHTATFGIRQGTDATYNTITKVFDAVIARLKTLGIFSDDSNSTP